MWLAAVVLTTLLGGGGADPWWSNAVYYSILVDSFKDSNGDGLGDLQGVTKQLSYVRALGADAVILSPISARSMNCDTPGTTDFTDIDERYGNLDIFKGLAEKAKKLELKLVITLTIETISSSSELFNFSAERKSGFEDKVVWRDGNPDETPPEEVGINHWIWHDGRKAYYGSSRNEAVLNLCSESLAAMLSNCQCTWLKRGIAGVLLNPDFPSNHECGVQLVKKMMVSATSCSRANNLETPVILVESSLGAETSAKYYGEGGLGANSVISYDFASPAKRPAASLALALHATLLFPPQDMIPTWLTSKRNESRIATRYGSEMVDAIILTTLAMPGAMIIQQGDELGAADTILEWASSSKCWPIPAVASAAPFPWDDTPTASFTSGEPWLPLAPNYRYANAKTEYANELSHIGVMKVASAIRKSPAVGPYLELHRLGEALAILRWGGSGSLLVVSNFGQEKTEAVLSRIPGLPAEMTVAASSGGSSMTLGSHVNLEKNLKLVPGESVLLIGPPRHCSGPGPVDKIASKLSEGWQKINKYFGNL
ncbi:maltase A3-like [Vanessa cardui]|uniref:maltase A3-like n=1 Tax=Vanessa cardui TaxID=171605 RepID=UPI001F13D9D8|nr:maltase A3-like [Vanessa cardui]